MKTFQSMLTNFFLFGPYILYNNVANLYIFLLGNGLWEALQQEVQKWERHGERICIKEDTTGCFRAHTLIMENRRRYAHDAAFKFNVIDLDINEVNRATALEMIQQWDAGGGSRKNVVCVKRRKSYQRTLWHEALVLKKRMMIDTNDFSGRLKHVLFSNQACYFRIVLMKMW